MTMKELEAALRSAVEATIREMGIENLKKISWFMSNRK